MVLLKTLIFTIVVPGTVTILVPYLLQSSWAAPLPVHAGSIRYFAFIPIVLGALIYFWCALDFAIAGKGTPAPIDPPKQLVARGLYCYVRNPMYVGILSILFGEAVLFESVTLFEYAVGAFLFSYLFVVFYEEPTLRQKFGDSYQKYCESVPRWLPRLRKHKAKLDDDRMAMDSLPADAASQPLAGRTILITRARSQASDMASLLTNLGATVIYFPTIEFIAPSDWAAVDAAINKLEEYDWILFTSANGVSFFVRRLVEQHRDAVAATRALTVAAIGPATAKALESAGVRVDLVAEDSTGEGALSAIISHLGGEDRLGGLRFLIPRARVARDFLPVELRRRGAHVDAVETYRTVKPDAGGDAIIRLLKEHKVDAVTFTSSSTVSNFAALAGTQDVSGLLADVVVACIGPVTAATAAEHGLKGVIQPSVYTSEALVEALVHAFGG